jgi:CHAD domain-containing protein
MLALCQTRITRLAGEPEHPVAELSLDVVRVGSAGPETADGVAVYYEVEVELKDGGTEDDLAALAAALRDGWPLEPETRSKFQRALESAGRGAAVPAEAAGSAPAAAEPAETPTVEEGAPSECAAVPLEGDEAPAEERPAKRKAKRSRKDSFLGDGLEVLEKPGLTAADTMPEAARKTLLYHLQKMMLHEPGTRDGEDPEELHDMRVATRRMRAALRVFEDHLDMTAYKPFLKVMRETGRELGAVRDLDVFMIKTQAYIDSLPPEDQSGLDPLVAAWRAERERTRTELLAYLDNDRYQRFKEKFETFLRTPGVGAGRTAGPDGGPAPTRVGDVLPGVLFDRLALVKAYDGPISEPDAPLAVFHQLRITSKGLRYTLEFFAEVLGSGSKPLIDRTKQVQDHLGDLQDAVVTCDVLLGFLGSGTWGIQRSDKRAPRTPFPVNAPGIATYLAVKQAEIERLMHTFGPLWDRIHGSEFSRPLAELIATL